LSRSRHHAPTFFTPYDRDGATFQIDVPIGRRARTPREFDFSPHHRRHHLPMLPTERDAANTSADIGPNLNGAHFARHRVITA
jgi:hypothetical protein